jgi:hypothetical protein
MIICIHCRINIDQDPHADDCYSRELIDHKMAEAILKRIGVTRDA